MTCRPTHCQNPDCGKPLQQKPLGRPRLYCTHRCNHLGYTGEVGCTEDRVAPGEYGAQRPLLGMSPSEIRNYRVRRVRELLRDGVPVDAVAERMGMATSNIYTIASRARLRIPCSRLPFGAPAP